LDLRRTPGRSAAAVYYVSADDLAASPPAGISAQNGYPSSVPIGLSNEQIEQFNLDQTDSAGVTLNAVNIWLNGNVTGDPLPLSLNRILTRLGTESVRQAMTATKYPFIPPVSVTNWIDSIT
jgi:hypothetical protein